MTNEKQGKPEHAVAFGTIITFIFITICTCTEFREDIRKSRCTTGINDTGGEFGTGVNDTGGK